MASPTGDRAGPLCPRTGGPPDAPAVGRTRKPRRGLARWLWPATGLAALIWFLVRVIPKPSRASYPCQRAAAPLAAGFVAHVLALVGSVLAFRKARRRVREARYLVAGVCVAAGVAAAGLAVWYVPTGEARADFTPIDAPNTPVGTARGLNPGRVVWVHDPGATSWDGATGYWWEDTNTSQTAVDGMMSTAVTWLAGAATEAEAWDALFRDFNLAHGKGDVGYQSTEEIAVKINLNMSSGFTWDNGANASPQVVLGLLRQLVDQAAVAESCITVYDASRVVGDPVYVPCYAEFPGVTFVDRDGGSGRVQAQRAPDVFLHYGDPSVERSGEVQLPVCVVEAEYMINVALLKGHQLAGVTFCAKNHFGSVWLPDGAGGGAWTPTNMHACVAAFDTTIDGGLTGRAMGTYNPLVELMGHEHLDGKALLYVIDALYAAPHQSDVPALWNSAPFGGDWTSSVLLSQDGVAIDSVAVDFAAAEPTLTTYVAGTLDNYLHEAAQAGEPPSGTFYDPEGDGTRLDSLGVHEHWNSAADKLYSRNLGTGDGIELVSSEPGAGSPPEIVAAPSADPNPVTLPATTTVSVTASDPDGGDTLFYTWTKVSGPGTVTFTPNGTPGSASSEAAFSASGDYTLRVSVSDGGLFVSADVEVAVHGGGGGGGGCVGASGAGSVPCGLLLGMLLAAGLGCHRRSRARPRRGGCTWNV